MYLKKFTSLAISAAIAASCFGGLALTSSAADEEYTVSIGTVTGAEGANIYIVNPAAPTPTPTAIPTETPTPTPRPTGLEPIEGSYTFIADKWTNAGTVPVAADSYLDGAKVYSASGNSAASNKGTSVIGGETYNNSLRLKGSQNHISFKVQNDSIITTYAHIQTQAGKERAVAAGTTPGGTDLGHGEVGVSEFTFEAAAGTTVYLTGVNASDWASAGDMYLAGFTVEPKTAAASYDMQISEGEDAEPEKYLTTLKAHAGDTIVIAADEVAGKIAAVSTAPETVVTANDDGTFSFTMPASDVTVNAAYTDKPLEDQVWTTNDAELMTAVTGAADGVPFGPVNGISGYGQWKAQNSEVTYTHTNGVTYNFTKAWSAGSGSPTKRSFSFTPAQACIVTVAYAAQKGRPIYITQGGVTLASGEAGAEGGVAATISADVEDPSKGNVVIYGGSSNKNVYAIFADYYDPNVIVNRAVSGKINYSGAADKSALKLVFKNTKEGEEYKVDFGTEYSVELRQNRSYDVYVEENGAKSNSVSTTLNTNSLSVAKMDKSFDVDVVDIAPTEVKGDVVVHEVNNDGTGLNLDNVELTFTAEDNAEFTYKTKIVDNKIAVTMMPNHKYIVTAAGNDGYALSALSGSYLMAAGDTAPFKNILFTEIVENVPFAAELHVGADKEYTRINDAITAVKAMTDRPTGEAGRVTILVDAGVYTEQVIVDSNYVTIKAADAAARPEIQWYYGIGYLYYSSSGNQYYSEDYAVAKTEKGPVTRWGAACRITGQNARLEDLIVKHTLNCEVTAAELADGVEPAMHNEYADTNSKPDRTVEGYDARAKSATERAAAIALDGTNAELYNCDFISSQDTFYTNNTAYVKDCYIEGGTDFVYGGNSVVFEDCTLAWHGYSDTATGGHLTANKNGADPVPGTPNLSANGYLFKNTTVTNSKYYPDNQFAAGSWGRNWGGVQTQVVFDGVKLDGVDAPEGWVKMSGELSTSILYVENVTDKNGAAVDTSSARFNPNGTMAANGYTQIAPADYFGNWRPVHYDGELPPVTDPTEDPTPGNTEEPAKTLVYAEDGVAVYASYNGDGTLRSVTTAAVKANDPVMEITDLAGQKLFVWNSLEGMKPVATKLTGDEKPTAPTESSKPEEKPTQDADAAANIIWKAENTAYTAGQDLGNGLSLVFGEGTAAPVYSAFTTSAEDPTPKTKMIGGVEFTGYVSSGANGSWSGTSVDPAKPNVIKYTAAQSGILTVYFDSVASNKKICVGQDGQKKGDIEAAATMGIDDVMALPVTVSEGETYYIYIAGSKARFCGAGFKAVHVAKTYTWTASESEIGKTAGAELMPGLALNMDNTSTNKSYVTGVEDAKWVDGALTGTALIYTAPADGDITVSFNGLGNVDQQKTVCIATSADNIIAEYTTAGIDKENPDLSTKLTAGTTYYIYGAGTKARFAKVVFAEADTLE